MPAPSEARLKPKRGVRTDTYLFFLLAFTLIVFLTHAAYFDMPYFWDELGQFVPAALDIYHDGAWIPHSAVPNAHAPGVMAYLAAVWDLFGYSIPATRMAMLLMASCASFFTFLLAIQLCRGLHGAPAFAPALLLVADPLFFTQAMMAQLDMPAMLFTVLALLLFLQDRHPAAALACTALVLAKETGALLPLVLVLVLLADRREANSPLTTSHPSRCLRSGSWSCGARRAIFLATPVLPTTISVMRSIRPVHRCAFCGAFIICSWPISVGWGRWPSRWPGKKRGSILIAPGGSRDFYRRACADGQFIGGRGVGALSSSSVAAGLHRDGGRMERTAADVAQCEYRSGGSRADCRRRLKSAVSISLRK